MTMSQQRQRHSLHIPGSPPGALPESIDTPSSDRRRSLISLPDSLNLGNLNLKSSKAKLQKNWWPGAKSPASRRCNDHTTAPRDLSMLILLAGEQMSALGNPRRKTAAPAPAPASAPPRPTSRQRDGSKLRRELDMTPPQSATASPGGSGHSGIQRKPLPAGAALPVPSRASPPPPIPELFAVNYYTEDATTTAAAAEPASPPSPIVNQISTLRRRAKTPVRHVGQLEAAQRRRKNQGLLQTGNVDGVNRTSSVSTIAREYRELAVYPDEAIPEVPEMGPPYLSGQLPATREAGYQDGHLPGAAAFPTHRRASSSTSDDGAPPGSEGDTSCPSLTGSSSPPAEMSEDEAKDGELPVTHASLGLQIGLELLTKELSRALAGGDGASAAGLQVWVMIEAYERLRERLEEEPTAEKEHAREAIDSWIRALYAIHGDIVSQGAYDSEYEGE